MSENYLTIDRNNNGAWIIGYEGRIGSEGSGYNYGSIPKQIFYGYSKQNAVKKFRQDNHIRGRHCITIDLAA